MNPCGTNSASLASFSAKTENYDNGSFVLKRKYINELMPDQYGNSAFVNFEGSLFKLPVETLQGLYLSLRNVFTDKCSNDKRSRIINCLLGVDQRQWEVLLKQVCFIMPIGTRDHDVMWVTEILSSVVNLARREKLTDVANRLFKYDTLTVERGYILDALAKLDFKELSAMDHADEQTRAQFVAKHVPQCLKEGTETVFRYDPFQKKME